MSVSWVYQENVCHQNYIMHNLLVKNIWKSYIWTADKDVNESDPRSNVHYLVTQSAVQIYDFHIFLTIYSSLHGFI